LVAIAPLAVTGEQIMMVSLAYSPELDKYAFQAIVPLGFLIQPGVLIRVDGEQDFSELKVARCEKEGCFIEGVPSEEMLQAFSSGIAGQIIMLNRQQKPFALPISFKGFSAALKEMLAKA
jgi:invasion protein IalB